jgi:uncharacterized membrane protein
MFFLPLLFIPLLAPTVLISTLANFGVGLVSRAVTHISYMMYYLSASIPFIFYAFIKGWPRFLMFLESFTRRYFHINSITNINMATMTSVLSGLIVTNMFFGPSPISLQFYFKDLKPAPFKTQDFHYSVYRITEHHCKVEEFSRLIPDSAITSAQQFLSTPLYKKRMTMIFPLVKSPDGKFEAEYVFFDKTNNGLSKVSPAYMPQQTFDTFENDKSSWELVKSEEGYFLYKRIKEGGS